MNFEEILDQVIALLQRRGRVSYHTLKLQFTLDDEALEALKEELLEVHHLAVDQDGRMLVWAGETGTMPGPASAPPQPQATRLADQRPSGVPRRRTPAAHCAVL